MKAEDAKLPGAGISLKQCPRKCVAENGRRSELSDVGESGRDTSTDRSRTYRKSRDFAALPGATIRRRTNRNYRQMWPVFLNAAETEEAFGQSSPPQKIEPQA